MDGKTLSVAQDVSEKKKVPSVKKKTISKKNVHADIRRGGREGRGGDRRDDKSG